MSEEIERYHASIAQLRRTSTEYLAELIDLRIRLAQAERRAQIASTAYDQQQSSYRELEALYQAAVERALAAEARIARAATHLA